ncbi:PhzF family phenazine biosynthesis protein [Edaphobacter sp. 12200R-103]|jgi:trans-2,3-dihydro-3-hydroxyanthranilate isomerase|uniref:PhzF family phenazine biosynthesis protein n=1 Tax=Edaphobacter sp. 12200R-103 TaxID=2703788 RepID=UPI00138C11D7|nr:PhzF family phenazine biosynthesis protein [Edaphobacter sp. 12200R-103]QHS52201.1 PhzF family phenazine biosynthesis protein [Edaphobacter sp. 12200R-103]
MSTMPTALNAHMAFEYALLDVFAERPLEGNQLAIFTDARGLTTPEMQAIARETNLSETTFLFPREAAIEQQRGVRVRIFTTVEELPFAGHPTLGTASWLYWNHPRLQGAETISLDLNVGSIPVRFSPPDPAKPGIFGTMRQNDPIFGPAQSHAELAEILNMPLEDIDTSSPIQTVTTGNPFCIVPLRSLDAVQRLFIPQNNAVQKYLQRQQAKFFYFLTRASIGSGADWHARMKFYNGEDPATGSAAGPAIAWLVKNGLAQSGQTIVIEQGVEMLRPSRLHVSAKLAGENITEVEVGGRTIPVAMGRLFLP